MTYGTHCWATGIDNSEVIVPVQEMVWYVNCGVFVQIKQASYNLLINELSLFELANGFTFGRCGVIHPPTLLPPPIAAFVAKLSSRRADG